MTRFRLLLTLLVVFVVPWGGAALAQGFPLGTNLDDPTDWETEHPFANIMKCSRAWTSQPADRSVWDDGRALDLDAGGYVRSLLSGQVATTTVLSSTDRGVPVGQYTLTYDGEGTIEYQGSVTIVSQSSGRDVLNVTASQDGVFLTITAVNPANYIRNMRFMMPGTADGDLFNPTFLDRIRGFRCIRFMPWQCATAGTTPGTWATRATPDDCRWTISWGGAARDNKGVPVEVMVALCNRLGADAWFSLPYTADDDYMARFAQYVAQNLDPQRRVCVEWSNEVWNSSYPEATYAQQQGLALGLDTDPFTAQIKFCALRHTQMFEIFEQYIPRDRLVRVLGSFIAIPSVSDMELSFRDTAAHTDAIAIAPYWGIDDPSVAAQAVSWSLDQLFAYLRSTVLPGVRDQVTQHVAIARRYGVQVYGYEGGQSLETPFGDLRDNAALNGLYDAANRDQRMGGLYDQWLQDWGTAGGALLMNYSDCGPYSVTGRWGALEYITEPRAQAPKYDALMRYLERNQAQVDPALTSPAPGSTLTSSTATFTWTAGAGVSRYWLFVGSSVGASDIVNVDAGGGLTRTASGIPTDGRTLYVRLWFLSGGVWQYVDCTMTAAGSLGSVPSIVSPASGSTLTDGSQTFTWSAGSGVTRYWLWIGSSPGGYELFNQDQGTGLSATASGLPTDGRTISVRLWYLTGGTWLYVDSTYQAAMR